MPASGETDRDPLCGTESGERSLGRSVPVDGVTR